jgi:hypothetical protein
VRPVVRHLALVTVALAVALQLWPTSALSTARAAPPTAGAPVTEQYAHIGGDPGSNEVDLALRTRLRERQGGRDAAGQPDGAGYTFEPIAPAEGGGQPDPCAQAGGQLVNVVRQEPGSPAQSTTDLGTACAARTLIALPAAGGPAISAEQVAALLRRVTLPGGVIRARPQAIGLTGLETSFWVDGAQQPPVDLVIGSAVLEAHFDVTGYRWSFGDGTTIDIGTGTGPMDPTSLSPTSLSPTAGSAGTGGTGTGRASPADLASSPDRPGTIGHVYRRRGTYTVTVEVIWSARGFLGGSPIAGVDGLVSTSSTTYRVDELYAVLTT